MFRSWIVGAFYWSLFYVSDLKDSYRLDYETEILEFVVDSSHKSYIQLDIPISTHNTSTCVSTAKDTCHDDVIKWKHFPRYWPFVRGIHMSPANSPHKWQWHGALMFSLMCVWINGSVNNREAGDLRRYRAHYDVTVMSNKKYTHVNSFVHSKMKNG